MVFVSVVGLGNKDCLIFYPLHTRYGKSSLGVVAFLFDNLVILITEKGSGLLPPKPGSLNEQRPYKLTNMSYNYIIYTSCVFQEPNPGETTWGKAGGRYARLIPPTRREGRRVRGWVTIIG